jgi:hypothetical protein
VERKGKGPVRVVDKSPSHTVGLKLIYGVPGSGKTYYASPSHTVGLEHYLPKSLKIKALTLSKLKQPTERAH